MYVVSYDISSDRLRTKVSKTLEEFGRRVQYSVFECHLTDRQFQELYARLMKLAADMEDGSIRFYQICANCEARVRTIGVTNEDLNELDELFIVV